MKWNGRLVKVFYPFSVSALGFSIHGFQKLFFPVGQMIRAAKQNKSNMGPILLVNYSNTTFHRNYIKKTQNPWVPEPPSKKLWVPRNPLYAATAFKVHRRVFLEYSKKIEHFKVRL